tara:strand:+ start:1285 stop:1473 length:189 start_codon:yes stop_codon:yes gene_type:complete
MKNRIPKSTIHTHDDNYSDFIEEQETDVTTLRALLIDGEQSGPAAPLDIDTFIANKKHQRTA